MQQYQIFEFLPRGIIIEKGYPIRDNPFYGVVRSSPCILIGSKPVFSNREGTVKKTHKRAGCAERCSLQNICRETAGSVEE